MSGILEQSKKLKNLSNNFRPARVLLTANNYRVFDFLTKLKSARAVSKRLDTDFKGNRDTP